MIQGGGMEPGMKQKATDAQIENEGQQRSEERSLYRGHGTNQYPSPATAQFFINVARNDFNHTAPSAQGWGYAVFAKGGVGTDGSIRSKAVKTGNKAGHWGIIKLSM